MKSETRTVEPFDQIELRYAGDVHLTQGDTPALRIEADQELLANIKSEVKGGTLYLGLSGDWLERIKQGFQALGKGSIKYYVTLKDLRAVKISGYGKLIAPELQASQLELTLSGYGQLELGSLQADNLQINISGRGEFSGKGKVDQLSVRISGSGEYQAKALQTRDAKVRISGHGSVNIAVSDNLDVTISGYGNVHYLGSPSITQTISGGGRVKKLE